MEKFLAFAVALAGALKTLFGYLDRRQQAAASEAVHAAQEKGEALEVIEKVHDAQVAAEHEHVLAPGNVRDDDGFRRD